MYDYQSEWMPCMQTMGMPSHMYPMMAMPEQQLERMYPRVYYIVYPEIMRNCDTLDSTHGSMYIPSQQQLDNMIDEICVKTEADVDSCLRQDPGKDEERQLGLSGRRLLRNLVGILLIRELVRRRRRPPFWGSPYGTGYPSF